MGVEAKHAYRFGYLKSEQWQTVRIEALVREKGKCQICHEFSRSNDAHHVEYPESIWDTRQNHLAILCRACHEFIHTMLEIHGIKTHTRFQFNSICTAIVKWKLDNQASYSDKEELDAIGIAGMALCRKCGRVVHRVQSHPIFEKSGGPKEKFKVKLCGDCCIKTEKFIAENYKLDDKWFDVYKKWKKAKL